MVVGKIRVGGPIDPTTDQQIEVVGRRITISIPICPAALAINSAARTRRGSSARTKSCTVSGTPSRWRTAPSGCRRHPASSSSARARSRSTVPVGGGVRSAQEPGAALLPMIIPCPSVTSCTMRGRSIVAASASRSLGSLKIRSERRLNAYYGGVVWYGCRYARHHTRQRTSVRAGGVWGRWNRWYRQYGRARAVPASERDISGRYRRYGCSGSSTARQASGDAPHVSKKARRQGRSQRGGEARKEALTEQRGVLRS